MKNLGRIATMKNVWYPPGALETGVETPGQKFDIRSGNLVCIGRSAVYVFSGEQTLFCDPDFDGAFVGVDSTVWFRFVRGDRKGK